MLSALLNVFNVMIMQWTLKYYKTDNMVLTINKVCTFDLEMVKACFL